MKSSVLCLSILILVSAFHCGGAPARAPSLDALALEATDGSRRTVISLTKASELSVYFFFSAHCPCQRAHDARLVALARELGGPRLRFYAVDSEVGNSAERSAREAEARAYPFPILVDREAAFASAVDAEYATYVVVLDSSGRIRFRGGIDSDRVHLTPDAKHFLRDALVDLLAGREPGTPEAKALGCFLQKS